MKNLVLVFVLLLNVFFVNAQINEDNDNVVEIDNFINASLYPNPSNGYFSIKVKNDIPYDVSIYAMNGTIIYNQKNVKESTFQINLESSIAKGFYHVSLRQGNNAIIKKLIIQ